MLDELDLARWVPMKKESVPVEVAAVVAAVAEVSDVV